MTTHYVLDCLLVILVAGVIVRRQARWRVVELGRIWRGPLIFGVITVVVISRTSADAAQLHATAVAILAFEAVLAVSVGAGMGCLSQFARTDTGGLQVRTGTAGSMLWLVLLAVRIGMDVVGVRSGATIVASGGVIVAMLALNRLGRSAVIAKRAHAFGIGRSEPALASTAAH